MKYFSIFWIFFLLVSSAASAQNAGNYLTFNIKKTDATREPSYPGGDGELGRFLAYNLNFPDNLKKKDFAGLVKVHCFVSEIGVLEKITVIESCGVKACDEEAVRVIKTMPKWNPGHKNGVPSYMPVVIPVLFSNSSSNNFD